jgi:predicted CxxxxCH...CXXCH cytochrome family protein
VFPVGTIIVKETEEADVTQRTVFAMVKRGGGFNATGAVGWEWFKLGDNADGSATILDRSPAPDWTSPYGAEPVGDCNGCHLLAKSNDDVWDTALQLSRF